MTTTSPNRDDYAALVLRLGLGGMYLTHGLIKLFVFTPAGTAGFFESLGFPAFLAYLVMAAEIGGGALLIAGLFTRWVALALIPVLLGALQVHFASGFMFSSQGGGWEYPAFLILTSVSLALLGDGAYSLYTLRKK
ncbi:MAG: DoxX family protein [Rhodospirillales bacterium]|nr:DoxX family protein [Rhodospirillales bacterium]